MAIALRGLDSRLRPAAEYTLQLAQQYGLNPTITSVYRSWSEQRTLRDRYLAGSSKWPANRPGDSAHNYGWAFDSWVPDAEMELWAAIRRYVGWEVFDSDIIHAQVPSWRQYRPSAFERNRR